MGWGLGGGGSGGEEAMDGLSGREGQLGGCVEWGGGAGEGYLCVGGGVWSDKRGEDRHLLACAHVPPPCPPCPPAPLCLPSSLPP